MIINRKKGKSLKFSALEAGEFFEYCDIVYLKVSNTREEYNVFSCRECELATIYPDTIVYQLHMLVNEV